jgi:zona occludens toxin (predicted ATPase)
MTTQFADADPGTSYARPNAAVSDSSGSIGATPTSSPLD